MSDLFDRLAQLSPEKRALLARRLAEAGTPAPAIAEPIAIVGVSCRLPGGADTPDAFWRLLAGGVDAVTEVPGDRWNSDELFDTDAAAAGKVASRWGGFLNGIDRFDPYFFGISPREAARMDPQQRLWLEVAFEAFEHAGLTLESLAGSQTGVFLGLHSHSSDYFWLQLADPAQMDAFTGPGNAHNIAAGRLAYLFDLRGPAVTVDTACSSSLVAVHMACQSLRSGDCRIAIAGGVNAMLSPLWSIPLSRMQMLSPTGRCRAFDASADGFVRGEGAGAVVLKRLTDALTDEDTILAVIRGSAVNQDGRTNGITAPNGLAQRALLRDALRNAGVRAADVTHVETHGTGTALGDPIELEALADVLGEGRSLDRRCWIGAVKSNLGHLEGAAGIAGLIKVVLSLQRRAIPPVVHFQQLNPHISVDVAQFPVPTRVEPWHADRLVAGVSSFGWSGTNAHVIVEQAPAAGPMEPNSLPPYVLAISARSREALRDQVSRYGECLVASDGPELQDVCRTAARRRSHHEYRIAAVGDSVVEMVNGLGAWLKGEHAWTVAEGKARQGRAPAVAFVFSGQGPQWPGMGRELLDREPFRAALERCDSLIESLAGWSVIEELAVPADRSRLERTEFAQPAIFALQVALAELWRAWGVQPNYVVGHSVGEIAAAWCAGALALEDAARVAVVRGRVMDRATGRGRMLSADVAAEEVRTIVADWRGLSIAAINAPRSLVLSGDADAVERAASLLSAAGISSRYLPVNYAFHSGHMEDVSKEVTRELDGLRARDVVLPLFSTVTGARCEGAALGSAYWGRNVRRTVRFADAIDRLARQHQPVFVEVGPHPVLRQSMAQTIEAAGLEPQIVESLRRGRPAAGSMLASVAALYAAGCRLDWRALYPGQSRPVALPPYAWQRERYWLEHVRPYSPQTDAAVHDAGAVTHEAIADWLYEATWQPDAARSDASLVQSSAPGAWLVLADRAGVGARLIGELEKRGDACVVLLADELLRGDSPDALVNALRSACEMLGSADRGWQGIVHLWSLDASAGDDTDSAAILDSQRASCGALVALVQALLAAGKGETPLWIATRGACRVRNVGGRLAASHAPVWGLARTLSIEHPGTRCVRVDLPESIDDGVAALLSALAHVGGEDQIAYRDGTRFVARLRRIERPLRSQSRLALHEDATYLITGGLGALGRATARWMIARGARRLVLASRSGASASSAAFLEELRRQGADVQVARADMSHEADVNTVFAAIASSGFPLKGVVHAAGVLDDGVLAQQTWARIRSVLAPKVAGAWNLHAASRSLDLDFFVLYSSLAGLLGSAGQASYAAANAFLDALAQERGAAGLPAVSINWGVWDGAGMAAGLDEASRRRLFDAGLSAMDPESALLGLEWALRSAKPQVAVMSVDWQKYLDSRSVHPAFLRDVAAALAIDAPVREPSLLELLDSAPAERRKSVVLDHVRREALAVLGVPAGHPIDNDQGLRDAGLDSLMALELKNRLQTSVGRPLPATLAFDFPTIAALAQYLFDDVLHLGAGHRRGVTVAVAPTPLPMVDLSDLTEDEAARMLAEELAALQRERGGGVLSGSKGSRRYTRG